jgi:hypothetical protein
VLEFDLNEDAPLHAACLGRETFYGCLEFLRSGKANVGKRFDVQNDVFRPIYVRRDRRAHHDYYDGPGKFTALQLLFSRKDLILSSGVIDILRELIAIEKRYVAVQREYLDGAVAATLLPKELQFKIQEYIIEEGTGALAPFVVESDSQPSERVTRPIRELITAYEFTLSREPNHGGNTLAWAQISEATFAEIREELRKLEKYNQPPWHPRVVPMKVKRARLDYSSGGYTRT